MLYLNFVTASEKDTVEVNILLDKCKREVNIDPKNANVLCFEYLEISTQKNFYNKVSECLIQLGIEHGYVKNYDAAIIFLKKANYLNHLIKNFQEESINWLKTHKEPDLIFMDIQLSDGLSFEIFDHIQTTLPLIFVTVLDNQMINAFKVNSIDYLLKPVREEALNTSIEKFNKLRGKYFLNAPKQDIYNFLKSEVKNKNYKNRILLKIGNVYKTVFTDDIAYFSVEKEGLYIYKFDGAKIFAGTPLDAFETMLNPSGFFRINRQYIINIKPIQSIQQYFNSLLILTLSPSVNEKVIVSHEKVSDFKEWLNQ
ncbi:MAG TPA: LytTR family DNA-binding domain-containing protein [Bacteroidales bacterium]|nr:LytTR family DNA-binding domain-containing protein [Bacteroidales bacterium]